MEWQPIETAPKDYQTILICPSSGDPQFAFTTWWIDREQRWANCIYDEDELLYWLPLPETPTCWRKTVISRLMNK